MRALVVEDDPVSARLIRTALEAERFVVEEAGTGEEALELLKLYDFDAAVVDLRLPDTEGIELVRRARNANLATPILILSAVADQEEKVRALLVGADDYLTKPFGKAELTARLRAIVRRSQGHPTSVIRTGRLTVDLNARTVAIDGKPLSVTPKEYGILELLSLRKGKTLTKEMFLDHLYGGMDEPDQKIVDVFICKLRKKIAALTGDEVGIQTVWGQGYVLREPDAGAGRQVAEDGAPFLFDEPGLAPPAGREEGAHRLGELELLLLQLLPHP